MNIRMVVTDGMGIRPRYLSTVKKTDVALVCIDDVGELKNTADVIVNGSIVPAENDGLGGPNGTRLLRGPEYMILDPCFAKEPTEQPERRGARDILITLGGSDPNGVTAKVLSEIDSIPENFRIRVVIGPAFDAHTALKKALRAPRHEVMLHSDVHNMAALISCCDLVVTAGGITLYEICACGRPALVIAHNAGQLAEAKAFAERRAAVCLGVWDRISPQGVRRAVAGILTDESKLESLAWHGRKLIDGRGVLRVAEEVVSLCR